MTFSNFVHRLIGFAAGAALMAGCSAAGVQPTTNASAASANSSTHLSPDVQRLIMMTRADHEVPMRSSAFFRSWMEHVSAAAPLLYVADNGYYPAVVDVFNFSTGAMVGQVADSFEYLYNPCSDKAGNVYVPDFKSGVVYEIQYRTTTVIKSWSGNGNPIGCSVNGSGNLAVTAFHFGGISADGAVIIYPSGGTKRTVRKGPGDDWPATYDSTGNLFIEADYAGQCTSPCLAELPKGGKSWKVISYDQSVYFPGSVELMGSVLGVGDQQSGGSFVTAIYATTVSGNSAHNTHTTTLTDGACSFGNDLVGWANIAGNPNGLQRKTVKGVAGANVLCRGVVGKWNFPSGGNPTTYITGAVSPNGATLIK